MIMSLIFSISVDAKSSDYSWYIIKNGEDTPSFPNEAKLVKQHGGYYIDEIAATKGEKIIYLTFDAGYENGNIEKIIFEDYYDGDLNFQCTLNIKEIEKFMLFLIEKIKGS